MLDCSLLSKIDNDLYHLPSENAPVLSADVGVYFGGKFVWMFDCGASDYAYDFIRGGEQIRMVISHFHRDHSYNLNRLENISELYVGKYSFDHFKKGNIVTNELYFEDNGTIHIMPIPNSHSKGSLAMEINEEYIFLGDSVYGMRKDKHLMYNSQLLLEQYRLLQNVNADKCLISHDERYVVNKDEILAKFEKILSKRKSGEPMIVL